MADTRFLTPFMGSVTATTTAQSLWTLLSAVFTNLPHKCAYLAVQLDSGAGGTTLNIGNSAMTSSNCGVALFAGQALQVFSFDSNLAVLDHIFLLCSASTVQVNVVVVVR